MEDVTFEQPRDGLQPDVRMRTDAHPLTGAGMVEEAPGADGPPATVRERPADAHTSDVGDPARRHLEDSSPRLHRFDAGRVDVLRRDGSAHGRIVRQGAMVTPVTGAQRMSRVRGSGSRVGELEVELVRVAPILPFTGLVGANDGVANLLVVPGRMASR